MKKLFRAVMFAGLAITIVFAPIMQVSAHSIWYNPSNGTSYWLSWYYRTSTNQAYIKVNQDYIVQTNFLLESYVDSARARWNNASSRVYAIHASFSTSNVDYATPTESYWISRVGEDYKYSVIAFADLVNLNGVYLSQSNIASANRDVKYAAIYVSPYDTTWDNYTSTHRIKILAHEMGHAFCLGHPDEPSYPPLVYSDDDSIMEKYAEDCSLNPTSHDILDLQFKYYN
jgi:hypothetical protein